MLWHLLIAIALIWILWILTNRRGAEESSKLVKVDSLLPSITTQVASWEDVSVETFKMDHSPYAALPAEKLPLLLMRQRKYTDGLHLFPVVLAGATTAVICDLRTFALSRNHGSCSTSSELSSREQRFSRLTGPYFSVT